MKVLDYEATKKLDMNVYLARGPGGLAVIKKFFTQENYCREVDALERLAKADGHKNVMPFLHIDKDAVIFLYLRAKRLRDHKDDPIDSLVDIFYDTCAGVQFMHEQGVVHGDLKPNSILIAANEPIVFDFDHAQTKKYPMALGGASLYSAPEALEGAPFDPRLDVFSLGFTLHCMLVGKLPTLAYWKYRIGKGVPPELAPIISKAIEVHPKDRYQSVAEMTAALQETTFRAGRD